MMSREDWEQFWMYLMKDLAIIVNMGCQHFDSVAEYLEWMRQEWLKWHDEWPSELPARMKR